MHNAFLSERRMADIMSDPHGKDEAPSGDRMEEGAAHMGKNIVSQSRMVLGAPVWCVHNDKLSVDVVSKIDKIRSDRSVYLLKRALKTRWTGSSMVSFLTTMITTIQRFSTYEIA